MTSAGAEEANASDRRDQRPLAPEGNIKKKDANNALLF